MLKLVLKECTKNNVALCVGESFENILQIEPSCTEHVSGQRIVFSKKRNMKKLEEAILYLVGEKSEPLRMSI